MATMNISLPDEMKQWAEDQTTDGKYANVSDYVRDLIRRDIKRTEAVAKFQEIVDEARTSPTREITDLDAFAEEVKQASRARRRASDAA